MFSVADHGFMSEALAVAARQLGQVAPNPAVGCVIVLNDEIVSKAATAHGGRPHAETQACALAGDKAKGATAYVTLEPCAHQGQTPPCASALAHSGIKRVVVACPDPDPRVNGKGIAMLRAQGIQVDVGLCDTEAKALNKGFFLRVQRQRPLVTLKVATSLDGMIAIKNGDSRWITSEDARTEGHRERATHDAVVTGIGTVISDNPELTVRLPDTKHQPVRIILDSKFRLPLSSMLAQSARTSPVWVVGQGNDMEAATLRENGVQVLPATDPHDLPALLALLADQGLTRIMVEAGGKVLTSFLQSGLYDRLVWFRAPSLLGADGISAIGPLNLGQLKDKITLQRTSIRAIGPDLMEIYEKD